MNSPHKGPVTRKCFHLTTSSWKHDPWNPTYQRLISTQGNIEPCFWIYHFHTCPRFTSLCPKLMLYCRRWKSFLCNILALKIIQMDGLYHQWIFGVDKKLRLDKELLCQIADMQYTLFKFQKIHFFHSTVIIGILSQCTISPALKNRYRWYMMSNETTCPATSVRSACSIFQWLSARLQ